MSIEVGIGSEILAKCGDWRVSNTDIQFIRKRR
jgi:hypothetical protein